MGYTYSIWDGSQELDGPDLELLLGTLADDLLAGENVELAIAGVAKRGLTPGSPQFVPALQQMLDELQDALRREWSQSDLDLIIGDLEHRRRAADGRSRSVSPRETRRTDHHTDAEDGTRQPADAAADIGESANLGGAPSVDMCGDELYNARMASAVLELLRTRREESEDASGSMSGGGPLPTGETVDIDGSWSQTARATDCAVVTPHDATTRDGHDFIRQLVALNRHVSLPNTSVLLHHSDIDSVRRILGERGLLGLENLVTLTAKLETGGYLAPEDGVLQLTARGLRVIAERLLRDTFRELRARRGGAHVTAVSGIGGEPSGSSRRYQYGDPFMPDIHRTVLNAVIRTGNRPSITLIPDDFEMIESDSMSQAATVLLLDISRSMPARGCFLAGKKVVLALHRLLESMFPRDHLYVAVFSDHARQVRPETLYRLSWGDRKHGTNMQHGLMLARRLLRQHRHANRQIIMVTDGEPTAHSVGAELVVAYPPTQATINATLQEVQRCTREGVVINTFMLAHVPRLIDFVEQLSTINRGRTFFAAPERLGEYVLADYLKYRGRRARQ